jgi:hypothetical protein
MADSGLSKFCAFLIKLVRVENDSAINAISVQTSKTLPFIGGMHSDSKKWNIKN